MNAPVNVPELVTGIALLVIMSVILAVGLHRQMRDRPTTTAEVVFILIATLLIAGIIGFVGLWLIADALPTRS